MLIPKVYQRDGYRALGMAVVLWAAAAVRHRTPLTIALALPRWRLGDRVDGQRPLAVIHAKDENSWQEAASGQSGH